MWVNLAMLSRREFGVGLAAMATQPVVAMSKDARSVAAPTASLTVRGTDVFLYGRKYLGIGCNFYDVLNHKSLKQELAVLHSYGVPFIRFDFGSFGPAGWKTYFSDRARWYGLRDDCIAAAEDVGMGLIPSFFWRARTVPELVSEIYGMPEELSDWTKPQSNTRKFVRETTQEIVERYRHSQAIWGWEIGNEYDFLPILSCNWRHNPAADKSELSEVLNFPNLADIFNEWGTLVAATDNTGRLISTGTSVAFYDVYACATHSRLQPDSFQEWMNVPYKSSYVTAPDLQNPYPVFNSVSAHVYQESKVPNRWFRDIQYSPPSLIKLLKEIADRHNRVLYLGEFGSLANGKGQNGEFGTDGSQEAERRYYFETLEQIIASKVQLSAVWNYGYLPNNDVRAWNIDSDTYRRYILESIAPANERLSHSFS